MEGSKLMDAFHKYQVNYHEFLEKYKTLNETTGSAREELQNQLADWIAETYPLRVRKPIKRKFAESEKNAVDVVFGDSLNGSLKGASSDYESLEYVRIVDLYRTNLDVGYINEPEDSDYRKSTSWRLAYSYIDVSDDELLQEWCAKYDGWEYLCKAIAKKEPLRIWYSENPRELCGLYYLCSLLKDYSADIYAVRVPERIKYKKERKYQLVYSTGQLDSDNAGRIVESAVKLTTGEIKMYAEEWESLKQENAPLRTVIAGKIVSVSEFFYDTTIWRYIPTEPKAEERVFREALSAMPYIQQGWLTLRIQKMIDNGHIEVVKDNKNPAKRLIRKRPAGDDTSTSFTSKKKLDSSSFFQNGA